VTSCYSGNLLVLVGYTAIPTFCSNHEQTPIHVGQNMASIAHLHMDILLEFLTVNPKIQ